MVKIHGITVDGYESGHTSTKAIVKGATKHIRLVRGALPGPQDLVKAVALFFEVLKIIGNMCMLRGR